MLFLLVEGDCQLQFNYILFWYIGENVAGRKCSTAD